MSENTQATPKPKIYAFVNSVDAAGYFGTAIAEDGTVLPAGHCSSGPGWARHDMGADGDCTWKHDIYAAHYPDGFDVEWVENARDHPVLAGLIAKANAEEAATVAPDQAYPADDFGAHILTESLGRIGDREIGPGHVVLSEARYRWLMASAGKAKGSPSLSNTILRVTIVVREGSTATQLTFAPSTKFEAGAAAVDRALASLQAERDESRSCPTWKDDFATGDAP